MARAFTPQVFEYFSEPKSRSNVWSRQRLEIKQELIDFSNSFYEEFRLADLGVEVSTSDHYPSLWNKKCVDRQWIFYSRGREARKVVEDVIDKDRTLSATITDPTPYFKTLFLALDLNARSVSMALYLHWKAWVDRDNLLKRTEIPQEREKLLHILRSLPDEYMVRVDGMEPLAAVDASEETLDRSFRAFGETGGFWSTGLFVPRDRALELGEDIWGVLKVVFMLLMPMYEFAAWRPDNDFISMSEKQREAEEKKLEMARLHDRELEAFKAMKEKERIEQKKRHQELVEKKKTVEPLWPPPPPPREKEKPAPESRPLQKSPEPQPPPKPKRPRPERPRPERARPAEKRYEVVEADIKPGEIRYGDRVRIMEGAFKGKWGIVQELDGKGNVKVILGAMVARLPLADVRHLRLAGR
jgi:hypothetical protein